MTRDQLERFRVRVRLGETFEAEEVERLMDELDSISQLLGIAFSCGFDPHQGLGPSPPPVELTEKSDG